MKSLGQRSVSSVWWNAWANALSVAVLFLRAVLLARMVPVADFGVYAGASAIVGLTVVCASFGMGSAFLHRAAETEDEEFAARVHFTLKLFLTLAWAGLMSVGVVLLSSGPSRSALLFLVATATGSQLTETPRLILKRRVEHRRLALLQVATAVTATLFSVALALRGSGLGALLATDLATLLVSVFGLYVWRPFWRPGFAWSSATARYYLRFGARVFAALALQRMVDRLGAVWTRFTLGVIPMGFFSRAHAFAVYPRRLLAVPVSSVVAGTYAELKGDRIRLSKAFYRSSAAIVRLGFPMAGLLVLAAPELVRLVLGEKWMPIVTPFRWMLVFAMLDPLRGTLESLFTAVGRPGYLVRVRVIQLALLVSGLLLLSPRWGITGVAIAVTFAVAVSVTLLLGQAVSLVDFSLRRLFALPALSLTVALLAAGLATTLIDASATDLLTLIVKVPVFTLTFAAVLFASEGREGLRLLARIRSWYV